MFSSHANIKNITKIECREKNFDELIFGTLQKCQMRSEMKTFAIFFFNPIFSIMRSLKFNSI